jgi:hypothetical protein
MLSRERIVSITTLTPHHIVTSRQRINPHATVERDRPVTMTARLTPGRRVTPITQDHVMIRTPPAERVYHL